MRFRVGRTVGRTIYLQMGDQSASGRDVLVGMVDTRELAALVVAAMNEYVEQHSEVADELVWSYSDDPEPGVNLGPTRRLRPELRPE